MTSEADREHTLQGLAADVATQRAQLIGLTAVLTHLPGVGGIDRGLVDAAIEEECRQLTREDRDTACGVAHSVLKAARESAAPGLYGAREVHKRGYQRGT